MHENNTEDEEEEQSSWLTPAPSVAEVSVQIKSTLCISFSMTANLTLTGGGRYAKQAFFHSCTGERDARAADQTGCHRVVTLCASARR